MELGYKSAETVRAMLGERWGDVELIADLAGFVRVIAARFLG
jgi:hypothetical protein